MQSIKEKRLEEFDKRYKVQEQYKGSFFEKPFLELMEDVRQYFSDSIDMAYEEGKEESNCPPHNFVPHSYTEAWSGTTPPPNMKCTKCLLTQYF